MFGIPLFTMQQFRKDEMVQNELLINSQVTYSFFLF